MRSRVRRRLRGVAAVVAASLVGLAVYGAYELSLRDTSFATGWILLALVVGLTVFNARKKLPFLPLVDASIWLQVHAYVGIFALVVFALHVGFTVPNGWLDVTLASLFVVVSLTGVLGLVLSRIIPRRLRTRGELLIYEREPVFLRELRDDLEELMDEIESVSLSEFYVRRLIPFFAGPRNFWHHLMQSHEPRETLLNELAALGRYIDPDEEPVRDEMVELIRTKDDVDYHHAHQAVLKYWLFVHIPLAYSLVIAGIVHAVVAYGWA